MDQTLKCAGRAQDKNSVDTLMLRFRPIAPKPTTTSQPFTGDTSTTTRRTKRKYVRACKSNKATCRSKNSTVSVGSNSTDLENGRDQEDLVTLQLLPERSTLLSLDHNNSTNYNNDLTVNTVSVGDATDTWLSMHRVPVETCVTVESVTGGSLSHAVRCTDEEIKESLDKDTSPGFVSDGSNRVMMVNEAYRKIVTGGDGGYGREVIVWLVVDQAVSFCDYRAFTCKVRLEYTWRETKYVKTVPCDVWKMEFGGFAWRLDTTAALTLWL